MSCEMITLPRAVEGESNTMLYRGLREESNTDAHSWWAPDRNYAAGYGDTIIAAGLKSDACILDLTTLIDTDGYITGKAIDEEIAGMADALGIDTETEVDANQLWDASAQDLDTVATLLNAAGWDGFRWIENENNEAYFLLH